MIGLIFIIVYFILLLLAAIGFLMFPYVFPKSEQQKVTIIVPARNEEHVITECLNSIIGQDYPKSLMQIILVDDASEDGTMFKADKVLADSGIEYLIVLNEIQSGKKVSIRRAMHAAKADVIVCRDADTYTASKKWLGTIVSSITNTNKEFIICPVAIAHTKGHLSSLQEVEMSILSLFTLSSAYFNSPFLCNGANLAFTKKLFYETGAYGSHLHIASGDDIFFLEEVKKKNRHKIAYLKNKEAIVFTFPEKDLGSLILQKIRWSSKLFKNPSVINWLSALIITASNFSLIGAVFYAILNPQNLPLSLIFILSKLLIDILLVFLASSFIKVKTGALMVVVIAFIYPLYASLIAILTVFVKPKWKSN